MSYYTKFRARIYLELWMISCVVKMVDNGSVNGCTDLGLASVGIVE